MAPKTRPKARRSKLCKLSTGSTTSPNLLVPDACVALTRDDPRLMDGQRIVLQFHSERVICSQLIGYFAKFCVLEFAVAEEALTFVLVILLLLLPAGLGSCT